MPEKSTAPELVGLRPDVAHVHSIRDGKVARWEAYLDRHEAPRAVALEE